MSRELRIGEDVLGSDGSRLGNVERLVVDEGAHQVTHLVVAGRVLPLRQLRDAGPDGLAADLTAVQLASFPAHDDASLEAPGDYWAPPEGYRLHDFLAIAGALLGQAPYQPPVHAELTPGESAHELGPGSPVWAGDRRLGEVVEVIIDASGEVESIVMARSGVLGGRVLIPAVKVIEVVGPNIQVELNETDIELLEPYEPEL